MINNTMTQNSTNTKKAQSGMMAGEAGNASRTCLATFPTTSEASSFKKLCEMYWIPARLMPVPRTLSSSCGTCVRFEGEIPVPETGLPEETEQIVELLADGSFRQIWRTDN